MARARRRPGIQGRLDAVQGHAHQTLGQAQTSMQNVEAAVLGLIDELQDGITLELRIGDRTFPVSLRIVVDEPAP